MVIRLRLWREKVYRCQQLATSCPAFTSVARAYLNPRDREHNLLLMSVCIGNKLFVCAQSLAKGCYLCSSTASGHFSVLSGVTLTGIGLCAIRESVFTVQARVIVSDRCQYMILLACKVRLSSGLCVLQHYPEGEAQTDADDNGTPA